MCICNLSHLYVAQSHILDVGTDSHGPTPSSRYLIYLLYENKNTRAPDVLSITASGSARYFDESLLQSCVGYPCSPAKKKNHHQSEIKLISAALVQWETCA
jgi:alpha-galactosidase